MAHSQYNEYTDDRGEVHKEYHSEEKKKSGHGGMLAAGAGGLAVGAIGGALVADALGELPLAAFKANMQYLLIFLLLLLLLLRRFRRRTPSRGLCCSSSAAWLRRIFGATS